MSEFVTTITGASDDLIEIDGQLSEELNFYTGGDDDEAGVLAFSDGTLLEVRYDMDGIWRFDRLASGTCEFTLKPGDVVDDVNDHVTLKGNLTWCCFGIRGECNPVMSRKK